MNKIIRLRAGIVPYYIHPTTLKPVMLFMIPANTRYGGPNPQCCKGKVEEGESLLEAALREGYEELGLFEGNIIQVEPLDTIVGTTSFFSALIKDPLLFGIPHFETGETVWLTCSEYRDKGRKLHLPVVEELNLKYTR